MACTLKPELRQELLDSIRRYFDENMDEPIGVLKATLLLDFVMEEIAPSIYNQAIADARSFIQVKLDDLDGTCYEPEQGYWKKD